MTITVKSATREDLQDLNKNLPTNIPQFHEMHIDENEQGKSEWLIAYVENQPVGHFLLRWDGCHNEAVTKFVQNCPHLESGGTKEKFRRQGVATTLIRTAEEMAKQRGFKQIGMAVGAIDNPQARHLYKTLGYVEWENGTFDESWQVLDSSGKERTETELCTYLIKQLT